MANIIALQEFIDGYKTVDIELGDRGTRTFREPTIGQLMGSVEELMPELIIKGDKDVFMGIYRTELTVSNQQALMKDLFERLGLDLGTLETEHTTSP